MLELLTGLLVFVIPYLIVILIRKPKDLMDYIVTLCGTILGIIGGFGVLVSCAMIGREILNLIFK